MFARTNKGRVVTEWMLMLTTTMVIEDDASSTSRLYKLGRRTEYTCLQPLLPACSMTDIRWLRYQLFVSTMSSGITTTLDYCFLTMYDYWKLTFFNDYVYYPTKVNTFECRFFVDTLTFFLPTVIWLYNKTAPFPMELTTWKLNIWS